jgi:spermidine synthase
MSNIAQRISFTVGLLSLSQEILWVRLASFGHQGRPQAFSIVLTSFLLGIAIGAIVGRWRCQRSTRLLNEAGQWLMFAGLVDIIILLSSPFALAPTAESMLLLGAFITLSASLKGVTFPIVHHLGAISASSGLGRSFSKIYVANIAGFILLSVLSAGQVFSLIAIATTLTGLLTCHGWHWMTATARIPSACFLAFSLSVLWFSFDPLNYVATHTGQASSVTRMIQNRQGIVHVASATDGGGSITYGGNVYDGRISVDLIRNDNRLDRAYMSAALHPSPARVLIIGLSTGAWTRVISGLKDVEHIDVVEINSAYLEIIRNSPDIAPILSDPKIHIHIDDGRRWLRAHPEKLYDLVFQNTTFHWRAYSTMLLSAEYFEEVRQHLKPGGIFAANTTGSLDVYWTAKKTFPHTIRYDNFVYMSDKTLHRRDDSLSYLLAAKIGDKPAFTEEFLKASPFGIRVLSTPLESVENYLLANQHSVIPEKVGDMNLVPEMRHGRPNPIAWMRQLLPANPSQ